MDILKKVLEKVTDTDKTVSESSEKIDSQKNTLDKMTPKIGEIFSTTSKHGKLLAKFHEKYTNNLKNEKKLQSSLNKNLKALNKKYEKLVQESVEKIPKNLKETLKSDKALVREIYLGIKDINEKIVNLGYTTRGIRTVQKNTKTQAPVVVNLSGSGLTTSATDIAPLTRIDHNIEAIAQYMKVLSESLISNPLRDREGKEDYKALMEDLLSERKPDRRRGRKTNNEKAVESGVRSIFDILIPGFLGLSAFNHINDYTSGYSDEGLRGAKLATSLLQPGGIKKPYSMIESMIPKKVTAETTEVVAKEAAKEAAEVTSKSWIKSISKEMAEGTLKGAAKAGKFAGKAAGKTVGKAIPVMGLGIGAAFAMQRANEGDYTGAGLEVLSGIFSLIPGLGTMASIVTDGVIVTRDIIRESKTISEEMKRVVDSASNVAAIAESFAKTAASTGSEGDKTKADYATLRAEEEASRISIGEKTKKYQEFKNSNTSLVSGLEEKLHSVENLTPENFEETYASLIENDPRMSKIEKDTLNNNQSLKEYYKTQLEINDRKSRMAVMEKDHPDIKTAVEDTIKDSLKKKQEDEYTSMKDTLVEYIKFFSKYSIKSVATPVGVVETVVDQNGKQAGVDIGEVNKLRSDVSGIVNDVNKRTLIMMRNPGLLDLVSELQNFGNKNIKDRIPERLDKALNPTPVKINPPSSAPINTRQEPIKIFPTSGMQDRKYEASTLLEAANRATDKESTTVVNAPTTTTNISNMSYPTHLSTTPDFGYERDMFGRIANK
jgi:hypothetical protein